MQKTSLKIAINLSLFALLFILNVDRATSQTTLQLNPIQAINASGYVGTNNINYTGDMIDVGRGKNSGYMTFDLSALPNGATITAASLTFNVDPASTNIAVGNNSQNIGYIMGINKNTVNSPVLFSDIEQGVVYADNVVWDGTPGSKNTAFLPAGIEAIQAKMGTVLGIGLRPPLVNTSTYGRIGGYNSTNALAGKPVLSITYTTQPPQKPSTDFYAEKVSVRIDSVANFFDNSGNNPTTWLWDFGDGETATTKNASHQYATVGTYTVKLKAGNAQGDSTVIKTNYMEIREIPVAPVADFIADNVNPLVNTEVQFWDSTDNQVSQWEWDFGDGNFGYEQNPINIYTSVGTYTVKLIVYGPGGIDSITRENYITVLGQLMTPVAAYGYITDDLQVNFSDSSLNAPATLEWDFDADNNPGFYISSEKNPSFTYTSPGTYKVCLTATNAAGTDTHCKDITVQSASAPVADFSSSANGLFVTFTDFSTNSPTDWSWTFGDTQTSTLQHPTHTYANGGNYIVCLNASNAIGSDSKCKTISVVAMGVSSAKAGISIFPNPASKKAFILANGLDIDQTRITLLNVLGETIVPVISRNGNLLELNIEGLESGIYFIRAEDGSAVFKQKISVY